MDGKQWMESMNVSDWIRGLWEREELKRRAGVCWGSREVPYGDTGNKGGRTDLGRKD